MGVTERKPPSVEGEFDGDRTVRIQAALAAEEPQPRKDRRLARELRYPGPVELSSSLGARRAAVSNDRAIPREARDSLLGVIATWLANDSAVEHRVEEYEAPGRERVDSAGSKIPGRELLTLEGDRPSVIADGDEPGELLPLGNGSRGQGNDQRSDKQEQAHCFLVRILKK